MDTSSNQVQPVNILSPPLSNSACPMGQPIPTISRTVTPDAAVALTPKVVGAPNPQSRPSPKLGTATNSSMRAPFQNDALVNSFWDQLSKAIGICMSYHELNSIVLAERPPTLNAKLFSFKAANQLTQYKELLNKIGFNSLWGSLEKVTDLQTLGNEFQWLFYVAIDDEHKISLCRALNTRNIRSEAKVMMLWPCGSGFAEIPLWTWGEITSVQQIQGNLHQLVAPYFLQYADQRRSELSMQPAALQMGTSHTPVHQHNVNLDSALPSDLDSLALPSDLDGLDAKNLFRLEPDTSVAVTECQERSRRLAEGDDGLVVLLDGRVVQGAFNWRTKCGSRGEKLRCFDYFLSMVKVTPEELPTAPMVANAANARESFVGHRHSSSPRGEVAAEVLIAGAFLTVGLLARLLWQRLKKPRDANSDAPRTCRTQQKTKVGFTKQHETGKDLDGECTIIPKPRFHTRLGRKLLAWFT
eukprot:GHVT01060035.1.p1 GENE.GHVT01060035.1~~GHVT01060035.1.p1  ORF type:complete len:470 (+),score=42.80 GHVT01060035.1:1057-2466(+)